MAKHALRVSCALGLLAVVIAHKARASSAYRSELLRVAPTTGNTWFDARADFVLDGPSVGFEIRFGLESVIPTQARIDGPGGGFLFDLGTTLIVIHSPGPWPDGYDGATLFTGSFLLPAASYADFVAGQTTLSLTGAGQGDFLGPILPLPGDTDSDGDIDDADLGVSFANYTGPIGPGGGKSPVQGDNDGDGDVDDSDLGSSFASYTGPRATSSVPEPGAIGLTLCGGLLFSRRRRPSH